MRTPEGYEKADLDKYLKKIGAYVVKPTTFGFGASGDSDRICCIEGRFWAFEVKREGKKPTPRQKLRIQAVEEAGGFAAWGTAADIIPVVKAWLRRRNAPYG